jgi:acetyltransferase-like isoleucine patch superfamily enzyme
VASDAEFAPGAVIDAEEVEIGAGASFGLGSVIRARSVKIGRRVTIGSFCFFEGRDIEIGDDTVIREQVFVGGPLLPDSALRIGKRVRVFQSCFLNPSRPLTIGDDTGVGGRSSIFTHGSWQSVFDGYPVAFEPVTIGKNVWLPWHVFILPGVELGDNVTVGAGSVINRSIPAGSLAAGVPAKVLRGADEWPRRVDREQQWSLARDVVEQMFGFFEDQGVPVERADADGRAEGSFDHGGRRRRVALVKDGSAACSDDDVVIELEAADGIGGAGNTRFLLLEKVKHGPEDDVTEEVERFLSRYGLRFVPANER